ncbi:MAG: M6 family metalloprotease domain-containing protein [Prevotellaceae bacterium]|nr:M6 family metalloprotease domain-containing protein [Prevotellaceae bacterium]
MKKITMLLCLSLLTVTQVSAVTANPAPIIKIQPDGTEITVRLRGDEKVHWMETLDGYTLMYDAQRYIVYATTDAEGNMIPSAVPYMGESQAQRSPAAQQLVSALPKGIRYSVSQVAALRQIWEMGASHSSPQVQAAPVTGQKKALCVLMGFPDRPFVKTKAEFENLMNQEGYNVGGSRGSVRDFYKENSYGQLELMVTVAGPYQTNNNAANYVNDTRAFAREAALAASDDDINFQDFAEGGQLTTFHIIFAGHGQEASGNTTQIWSHKWQLASPITLDGVRISVYSCSPELRGASGNNLTYIGVICHELCHVFGAPDYYDTDEESSGGDFLGTGDWDLMAGGSWNDNGRTPPHINMFQKILYGWVTPIALSSPQNISEMPNSAENPVAYTVQAHTDGEMYVLENRQKTKFDSYIPGHGLLIYHVHRSAYNNNASNDGLTQQMYPVCASSTVPIPGASVASYGSINTGGCPFPGTSNNHVFTDYSTPMAFSWATHQGINKPIASITETGDKISFEFMPEMPDLREVKVNGKVIPLPGTNETMNYMADCGERGFRFNIESNGTLTIRSGASTYMNGATIPLSGDRMDVTIVISTESGNYPFPITIAAAIDRDELYIHRWGKTLAVINNPAYNGGYTFDGFRWFDEADTETPVGTNSYIVCGNDCQHYYAEGFLNNTWHRLCRNDLRQSSAAAKPVTVYPNPVEPGQLLFVELPEGSSALRVRIVDIHGRVVGEEVAGKHIQAPAETGLYFLQTVSSAGAASEVSTIIVH